MVASTFNLVTENLYIRPFERRDLDEYTRMMDEMPEVPCPIPNLPQPNYERGFLKDFLGPVDINGSFAIAAFDRKTDQLVLDMHFYASGRSEPEGSLSVTYYTRERFRGMGMMTQAMQATMSHLIAEYGVTQFKGNIEAPNLASRKVVQKLGFQPRADDDTCWVYKPL